MSLLVNIYQNYTRSFLESGTDAAFDATFEDGSAINFILEDHWKVEISDDFIINHPESTCRVVSRFLERYSNNENFRLDVRLAYESSEVLGVMRRHAYFSDLNMSEIVECGSGYTISSGHTTSSSTEILIEEPNTSLMYHKLFPDTKLLRDLERIGYTFKMGSGLKISKQHYSTTHRGSKSKDRRKLQSIVILKDNKFYRKIPKAKWVELIDPTDATSVSIGTKFMKRLLHSHDQDIQSKWDVLQDKRSKK